MVISPRRALVAATLVVALAACGGEAAPESAPQQPAPPPTSSPDRTGALATVVVHKSPDCTCCDGHVAHLEAFGFSVEVVEEPDVAAFKHAAGVPDEAFSCHTAEVGGYVVEGHVPGAAIRYLLATQPDVDGIAVPGMPAGSPGMPGQPDGPLTVLTIDDGAVVGELGAY